MNGVESFIVRDYAVVAPSQSELYHTLHEGSAVAGPQLMTPPDSAQSLSSEVDLSAHLRGNASDAIAMNDALMGSISTTFHYAAGLLPGPTDLMLLSSDGVLFYVHRTQIASASTNNFNKLLSKNPYEYQPWQGIPVIPLPEVSSVLNIVLHVVYGRSCAEYRPRIDSLIAAVDAMATYGFPPQQHIAPSTTLYAMLLNQSPLQPILVYALAAAHNLPELAVAVSTHLLSYPLSSLTNDLARRIGSLYMKRLYSLHLGRLAALRRLLIAPPHPHPPTSSCDFAEQKKLMRAWALASAYLAWDARPDMTASTIESVLCSLADLLPCEICKRALGQRVKELITQWSMVKVNMIDEAIPLIVHSLSSPLVSSTKSHRTVKGAIAADQTTPILFGVFPASTMASWQFSLSFLP